MILTSLQPIEQQWLQLWQVEEEVLGDANLDGAGDAATESTARSDELGRIERVPAVVALVAPRVAEATVWAGAVDIAVGQESRIRWAVGRLHRVLEYIALLEQAQKKFLRDAVVILGGGLRE